MAFDLTDEELQATREMNKTSWESEINKWSKEYLIERYKDLVKIEKEHKKENGKIRMNEKKLEKKNIHYIYINLILYIIMFLVVLFLLMNIKIRNDKIWQQRVEIEDLKEQIEMEKLKNEM